MPTDESLRLDDHQSILPIEQSRPKDERGAGRIRQSSWLGLAFFIEGQLFSEEQDLGTESGTGMSGQTHEPKAVARRIDDECEAGTEPAHGTLEESEHGTPGWHRSNGIEKSFRPFSEVYRVKSTRDNSRHPCEIEHGSNFCVAQRVTFRSTILTAPYSACASTWVASSCCSCELRAMRHSSPETKRHYQLGMTEQVRQNLEKANEKVYGQNKVLRFYDVLPETKDKRKSAVRK